MGIKEYHSSPRGTYSYLLRLKKSFLEEPILLKSNSYIRTTDRSLFASKHYIEEYAQIVDITEVLNYSNHHARAIRIARRQHLNINCTETIDEWKKYFELYRNVQNRRGKTRIDYEWELFEKIRKLNPSFRKLWVVYHNNKLVAGAICFYWNKTVNYWHGATDFNNKKLNAGHLLHDSIINHAKNHDFRSYDMGNSTNLDGVDVFKAGFGAKKQPNYLYYRESIGLRIINKWRSIRL